MTFAFAYENDENLEKYNLAKEIEGYVNALELELDGQKDNRDLFREG